MFEDYRRRIPCFEGDLFCAFDQGDPVADEGVAQNVLGPCDPQLASPRSDLPVVSGSERLDLCEAEVRAIGADWRRSG